VLTSLTQKCRESRSELAAAIIAARRTLAQARGVSVTVVDYLRGVDRVVPAGSRDVDCTATAPARIALSILCQLASHPPLTGAAPQASAAASPAPAPAALRWSCATT
jgi:hypothetical protein